MLSETEVVVVPCPALLYKHRMTNDKKVGSVGVGKVLLAEKLPKDRSSKGLIPEYAPCIPLQCLLNVRCVAPRSQLRAGVRRVADGRRHIEAY